MSTPSVNLKPPSSTQLFSAFRYGGCFCLLASAACLSVGPLWGIAGLLFYLADIPAVLAFKEALFFRRLFSEL